MSCNCLRKNIALSSVTSAKKFNHRTKIHNKIKKWSSAKWKMWIKLLSSLFLPFFRAQSLLCIGIFSSWTSAWKCSWCLLIPGLGKRKCFNKNIMYKKCVFKIIVYSAKIPKILLSEWTLHSMKRHKERETGTWSVYCQCTSTSVDTGDSFFLFGALL